MQEVRRARVNWSTGESHLIGVPLSAAKVFQGNGAQGPETAQIDVVYLFSCSSVSPSLVFSIRAHWPCSVYKLACSGCTSIQKSEQTGLHKSCNYSCTHVEFPTQLRQGCCSSDKPPNRAASNLILQ